MFALIVKTISVNRKNLLAHILVSVLLAFLLAAFFPSVHQQAERFNVVVESYPETFLKAFGVGENVFLNFESFLAAENFSLMWPLILIVLAVALGGAAIAGEIEQGTIPVLLAQPISRARIYLAKYLSGFLIVLIFTAVSVFAILPLARLYRIEPATPNYFTMFVLGLLFGWCIFSLTIMFSSVFSAKGKPASLAAGILILMYALNLVSKLRESAESLSYLSLFHYYDYNAALCDNRIGLLNVLVFLGVGAVCALLGLLIFVRRDIAA